MVPDFGLRRSNVGFEPRTSRSGMEMLLGSLRENERWPKLDIKCKDVYKVVVFARKDVL
jgi:hypothetical protein